MLYLLRFSWSRAPSGPAALLIAVLATAAAASPTDPTLAVTGAASFAGAASRVLRVEGSFHAEDLVQLDYPLQLLVRDLASGTVYVRYDGGAGAVTGDSASLADGLDPGDVGALLSQGAPAPGAGIVFVGSRRIEVRLPAGFPAGSAEVQLFVLHEGDPVLSNVVPVDVEAQP